MWLLIGVAMFVLVSVVRFVLGMRDNIPGNMCTSAGGKTYYWHYRPPTRKSRGESAACIENDRPFEFEIVPEGRRHSFSRWLGFSNEFQTQDQQFDARFFIISDDPAFCQRLRADSLLRQAIGHLFASGVSTLKASPNKITAELENPRAVLSAADETAIVDTLYRIRERLRGIALSPIERVRHPSVIRSLVFISFHNALLIIGFIAVFIHPYKIVDDWSLFRTAGLIGGTLAMLQLLIIRTAFHGSSRGYVVIADYLFSGIAGFLLCTYAALYGYNVEYDISQPTYRQERIIDKYTTKSRKGGRRYHITFSCWQGKPVSMQVDYSSYNQANVGSPVRFVTHQGRLGFEWIKNYQVGR